MSERSIDCFGAVDRLLHGQVSALTAETLSGGVSRIAFCLEPAGEPWQQALTPGQPGGDRMMDCMAERVRRRSVW